MASIEAHTSRDYELLAQESEPLLFSDEEGDDLDSDYNYYTDEDSLTTADEANEEQSQWDFTRLLRGVGALMLPILMSASLGVYLASLQAKKPPQAWSLFGGSGDSASG